MTIVHVIPALTKGGAERVVIDLANHAAEAGEKVTVLVAHPTDAAQWPGPLRSDVELRFIAPGASRTSSVYPQLPAWMLRNRKWLLERDVVHCHLTFGSIFGASLQALRFISRSRSPAVVETNHSVGMAIPRWRRVFHSKLLRSRDAVAVMAEDSYWRSSARARRGQLWRLIPNGVGTAPAVSRAAVSRYRREAHIPDDAFVVGSVGRLLWERRPDLLLATFARLVHLTKRKVHLLLAGDGPMRSELQSEARRQGLENRVHLPGAILNPGHAFGTTDLYLTVNVGPITGIAALEAAFAGLPIVAMQLDPLHRRTDADWIWSSTDPEELAAHIAGLIDDPSALEALAAKQGEFARANHSLEVMADAYNRLYEDARAARGAAGGTSR